MLEDGHITDFKGTYEEYLAYLERQKAFAKGGTPPAPACGVPDAPEKKPKRPGGTKELEKQVAAAERAVARAEEKQFELTQRAEEVASNYLELQKVMEEQKALEEEIAHLYTVWETLSAELEEARGE